MTRSSWREQQKTFFLEEKIEFEQDQRILDWIDVNKSTFIYGDNYFNSLVQLTSIKHAEQALIVVNSNISVTSLELFCTQFINIPRVCLAINKFVIYTDTYNDVNEDYDLALLDYIKNIFKNRSIDYHYVANLDGSYFNSASPTTQFFIT